MNKNIENYIINNYFSKSKIILKLPYFEESYLPFLSSSDKIFFCYDIKI